MCGMSEAGTRPELKSLEMRLRLLSLVIFWLSSPLLATAASLASLDSAIHYKTASITLVGNRRLSDADLLAVMQTTTRPAFKLWKSRPLFSAATFRSDIDRIKRLYEVNGYYAATVNYCITINGRLVKAEIRVIEGEPVVVKMIRITLEPSGPGVKSLDPSFELPLKEGETFNQNSYVIGETQLLDVYMRHGYAHAQVSRRAQVFVGPREAFVSYMVKPGSFGVFGSTSVRGTKDVSPNLVLRELTYKPGEMFDAAKVAASRARIVGLNLFRSVEFIPQVDSSNPELVPIVVNVQERPRRTLSLRLGYNTQSQFNVGADWRNYNFLGGGRQLSLLAQYSDVVSRSQLKLIQPYLFSSKSALVAEVSAWQEVYQTYTLNAGQVAPSLSYQFTSNLTGSLGWRLAYLKFDSLNPITIAAIGGVRPSGILSGPRAELVWNDTEDPFNPQHGQIATLYSNTASRAFGSDYRYWRALAEVRKYHLLGWKTVLAGRLELGFEHSYGPVDDIPLSERFYSGGEGSIRGYGLRRIGPLSSANQPLGGLSLFESSLELRRPLFWRIGGTLFSDCGQVSTHEYRVPIDGLQCGFGPGISVTTPVGPMMFDLGFPTKPPAGDAHWQLYFGIGQWF